MVGVMEQHFIQASAVEDFAAFAAPSEVLFSSVGSCSYSSSVISDMGLVPKA